MESEKQISKLSVLYRRENKAATRGSTKSCGRCYWREPVEDPGALSACGFEAAAVWSRFMHASCSADASKNHFDIKR